MMEFKTKQELYNYLNEFDFDSVRETPMSSVYFLIKFNNCIDPIYFTRFEDVWFESPCNLHWFPLKDEDVFKLVKSLYYEGSWKDAFEFEKTMQRNGIHYDIDCPQISPFLPECVKIIDIFTESQCLDWLLNNRKG